jgi:NAD-dependent dihydropyrimidine dehydrogenase PreA subunit
MDKMSADATDHGLIAAFKAGSTEAVGVSSFPVPATVKGATQEELATLIDIRKCIGCEVCVEACQEVNEPKFPEPKKTISEDVSEQGQGV